MRANHWLLLTTCGLSLASVAAACGPGDDCEVRQVCPTDTGGGGTGGSPTVGGGGNDGGGGALPGELGFPCAAPGECNSGFCVDGVCCAGACDGTCEACDGSGTCSPEAPGTDPDGDCSEGVCDGAGVCATGAHRWSKRFGDGGEDELTGLDVHGGAIGIVGRYEGSPEFGLGPLTMPSGNWGAFAVSMTAMGAPAWSKAIGDDEAGLVGFEALSVAATTEEVMVIGGKSSGVATFGAPASIGLGGFLGALSPSGVEVFTQVVGEYNSAVWQVAAAEDGSVVIAGNTHYNTATVGGMALANNFFVMKLTSSGTSEWAIEADGADLPVATDMATTASGHVLVVGQTTGAWSISQTPVPGTGERSFFLRLDSTGALVDVRAFGSSSSTITSVGAVGEDAVVAGGFSSTLDLGGPTLTASAGEDLFVARLDADGNHVWSQRFGAAGGQRVTGLAASSESLVVAGINSGEVDFGAGPTISSGGFLAKLHGDGDALWSRSLAGPVTMARVGLGDDAVYVAGSFTGNVDLGDGVLSSAGGLDIFVAAFDP